jgi:hypothetical protein
MTSVVSPPNTGGFTTYPRPGQGSSLLVTPANVGAPVGYATLTGKSPPSDYTGLSGSSVAAVYGTNPPIYKQTAPASQSNGTLVAATASAPSGGDTTVSTEALIVIAVIAGLLWWCL